MHDERRFKLLHGPYTAPRCRLGKKLFCERRGWVIVRRVSDGRVQWPEGARKGGRAVTFVLCGDLAKAVRRESNQAVCYWWGVTPQTVTKWRKALDVPRNNEGSTKVWRDNADEIFTPEIRARSVAAMSTPDANAKKSAWRMGRPIHPNTLRALERSRPKTRSLEHRRRISDAHRRRGTRPPRAGRPWTAEEDSLLGTMPDEVIVHRTGRILGAVYSRRQILRIPSFRNRGMKMELAK